MPISRTLNILMESQTFNFLNDTENISSLILDFLSSYFVMASNWLSLFYYTKIQREIYFWFIKCMTDNRQWTQFLPNFCFNYNEHFSVFLQHNNFFSNRCFLTQFSHLRLMWQELNIDRRKLCFFEFYYSR
jgi:hypothetical protein